MLRVLIVGLMLIFAAGASAQLYRWVDSDGKVRYSDTPPTGVKATTLKPLPDSSAPPAAVGDAAAKDEQASRDTEAKQDNCARARETLATLESGQRIVRTQPNGERYYVDDDQRAAETQKARQSVNGWCN